MDKIDVYKEIGITYRYFLDWRHKLLAGYLITVSGIAIGFSWGYTNPSIKPLSWLILLMGFIVTIIFLCLDIRNRKLYHICQKSGAKIELYEKLNDGQGVYTELVNSKSWLSHSIVLNVMYGLAAIVFLLASIYVGLFKP